MSSESKFNFKLFFISFFLGIFGIDRFYAGKNGSGTLKLLTLGGYGIWWLVDLYLIAKGEFVKDKEASLVGMMAGCCVAFCLIIFWGPTEKVEKMEEKTAKEKQEIVYGESVTYGGEIYETVVIGKQTWLKRNLNYKPNKGSWCYGEGGKVFDNTALITLTTSQIQANCAKYGRLYDWAAAMDLPSSCNKKTCASQIKSKHKGICPPGYHIPTNADWDKLYRYADGKSGTGSPYKSETAGRYLKADINGWNGKDIYGFSALPGGVRIPDNAFMYTDSDRSGSWWSANEAKDTNITLAVVINTNVSANINAYERSMSHKNDIAGWSESPDKVNGNSVRCVKD
jgi:uncharacterized protein (TIGR02145 family)